MYAIGSMWHLLIILKPILTLEYSLLIYIIEQWSVFELAEENSNHNNFLFSSRGGECMYKENIVKSKQHGRRFWCKLFLTLAVIFIWKRLNPVDTNGFWHAPGSVKKPCEVTGVMTGFCSADLSEGVACWTRLTVTVASSEGIIL